METSARATGGLTFWGKLSRDQGFGSLGINCTISAVSGSNSVKYTNSEFLKIHQFRIPSSLKYTNSGFRIP